MKKTLVVFVILFCSVRAAEFLYPIHFVSSDLIYLIYQKTAHHIELWEWHPTTGCAEQMLMSRFTPAGLQLLPSKTAYSFIDNGIIKIKAVQKRSPKSLELDAPVARIELINWITDSEFYTSAEYRGRHGIFQINNDGEVFPVALDDNFDFQYPCKVGDFLFCIEHSRGGYRIARMPYRAQGLLKGTFRERVCDYYEHRSDFLKTYLVSFGLQPIVFLKMVSGSEGFVLEHQKAISKRDIRLSFTYHRIHAHDDAQKPWEVEKLFSFTIPTELLLTEKNKRLYEALLPLLPRHIGTEILFSDAGEGNNLSLFRYDLLHAAGPFQCSPQAHDGDQFFAPMALSNGSIVYGGQLHGSLDLGPHADMSQKGVLMELTDRGIIVYLPNKL